MKYLSFHIENFKGIKNTDVDLRHNGASVFAFVGLNESGKTTLLEALHSFSPDGPTGRLFGGENGVPIEQRVPRHELSTFTGSVLVAAKVLLQSGDKDVVAKSLAVDGLLIDVERIPNEVEFEHRDIFKNGDFETSTYALATPVFIKTKGQKNWRQPKPEETDIIWKVFYARAPNIAYFPDFVFDFPKKIFLTEKGDLLDRFYRSVFQDILDFDGVGHSIKDAILRRVRADDLLLPWSAFLDAWRARDDRAKIQQVMDRAGATVTKVVFGKWNKIFDEEVKGKEVVVNFDIIEGEKRGLNGTVSKTNEHDVVINFEIRDGTRRFSVNDRSLGFRWFFSFMLFTQFRAARAGARPLLFLVDEPASNLHSAAQQKLIDSFPEIATGEHALIYTTHSHYMIEPKWLEQTFIVTNRSDAPSSSIIDGVSLDDSSLDIKANLYRKFVDSNPSNVSYFQPIIDRLQIVPSRFDLRQPTIVLEGKSDYYILRYASKLLSFKEPALMPGVGATTFGALVSIHAGWNLDFLFLLDSDAKNDAERYASDFIVDRRRFVTLSEIDENFLVIENLLDAGAMAQIQAVFNLSRPPSKGQIRRFFQEKLAGGDVTNLTSAFAKNAEAVLTALRDRLSQLSH